MFSSEQVKQLQDEYLTVHQKYNDLLLKYMKVTLQDSKAQEYKQQGFLRRLSILKRCLQKVYEIYPPEREDKPSDDERADLEINIQSFVFNLFGCIDNLAWIWVKENNFQCKNSQVRFSNKEILRQLSSDFQDYWKSEVFTKWLSTYLTDFRHALGHRIPLYIPPSILTPSDTDKYHELEKQKSEVFKNISSLTHQINAEFLPITEFNDLLSIQQKEIEKVDELLVEQRKLGKFEPVMAHSFSENSVPVKFHAQLLADWNTLIKFSSLFLDELNPQ